MDDVEALRRWLLRAFEAGQLSVRLERQIERGRITLSHAIGLLDRVLAGVELLEAPCLPLGAPHTTTSPRNEGE